MFRYENLDAEIRVLMMAEATRDQLAVSDYYGRRLTDIGRAEWPKLLRTAITVGDSSTLSAELKGSGSLKTQEPRTTKGITRLVTVPSNASDLLAQGEFNRYYNRGVCLAAIKRGQADVVVYRARHSENPRPESERLIGTTINAQALLDDLRRHPGEETDVGLPMVNSGLSVKLGSRDS